MSTQYYYDIVIGEDFWYRLTGDKEFYSDLIKAISDVAIEANYKEELDKIIDELSKTSYIQELSKELNS
ncbi:PmeII family type II restriction endonuclease [Halarcobacter sp.]|uniref:PmeII family type II restriction endonuclease n=1 Tax=Halarcobacter sp. TaxID=2321133 RepID=UPI002AAC412B|nr:PmeII family type II restriction endonuclease [Halarcobacter sp.]